MSLGKLVILLHARFKNIAEPGRHRWLALHPGRLPLVLAQVTLPVLAAVALSACGPGTRQVSLADTWPKDTGSLSEMSRAWTRRADLYAPITRHGNHVLEVHATFKSPAWRAAYVKHRAQVLQLRPSERASLLEQQRGDHSKWYELELLIATYDRRADDLQKNLSSTWRVALSDDKGNEIRPVSIKRDRRPRSEIAAEFPDLDDFHTAYVARFPRSIELLGADAKSIKLVMASSQGGVELLWAAREH